MTLAHSFFRGVPYPFAKSRVDSSTLLPRITIAKTDFHIRIADMNCRGNRISPQQEACPAGFFARYELTSGPWGGSKTRTRKRFAAGHGALQRACHITGCPYGGSVCRSYTCDAVFLWGGSAPAEMECNGRWMEGENTFRCEACAYCISIRTKRSSDRIDTV